MLFRFILLLVIAMSAPASAQSLILDTMENEGAATYGGRWAWSTDQVMGGVSTGQARYVSVNGDRGILIEADVSTANNGGFAQVSLSLRPTLNARAYTGVELRVKGDGNSYWVHLRDASTRLPWQVFQTAYETTGAVQTIRVPFSAFRRYRGDSGARLDTSTLRQIGMVAGFDDFQASLTVLSVALY